VNLPAFDPPRLLVSVRDPAEAEAALAGGCDLLDVKDPARGALGMADPATIAAIVSRIRTLPSSVPVSAALGELAEWERTQSVRRLPQQIAYLKLGTAGLGTGGGWARRFAEVMHRIACDGSETASDGECDSVKWIAVAYADWEIAGGPCPEDVIEGAQKCGCAGILIDTFSKDAGRLFDLLSVERLESMRALVRSCGLEFVLAGRLQIGDLPRLALVGPDIAGIRSAACRAGIRTGRIDTVAVRMFREALRNTSRSLAPAIHAVHPSGFRVAHCG
jgi:uncharacterized protein (UPF0264 family)